MTAAIPMDNPSCSCKLTRATRTPTLRRRCCPPRVETRTLKVPEHGIGLTASQNGTPQGVGWAVAACSRDGHQARAWPSECVLEPGGCTAFRSDYNSNVLTHPAQREAVLEPGGNTAFRSRSNSRMLTHPAQREAVRWAGWLHCVP